MMVHWVRKSVAVGVLLGAIAVVPLANAHTYRANRSTSLGTIEGSNGGSVGTPRIPTKGPHVGSMGSTVVADAHGLVVAERNAGVVIRADRDGKPVASLAMHEGLGQLVGDGRGAVFVADRQAHRVVRIDAARPDALSLGTHADVAEPYGVALTPDGKTLYVTSVADHALVALRTRDMTEAWRVTLRPEPRGVAVSADGKEATVGFLSSGALAVVDLTKAGETVRWRSLQPRDHVEVTKEEDEWSEEGLVDVAVVKEARSRFEVPTDTGRRHARNVFGVAYLGHGIVAAPHQLSTPQMKRIPSAQMQDSYGGGPETVPAIVHRLALVEAPGTARAQTAVAQLSVHQPRALAYDVGRDTLYVAGYGDDRIVAIADASQGTAYSAWAAEPKLKQGRHACGPDGIAIDGDDVWVHCELSRRLVRIAPRELDLDDKQWLREKHGVLEGPELAASSRSPEVEKGAEIFRRGDDWGISDSGVMACASCHPDGRQDGLSWRLGKSILQTPMLAGRVAGTAPYKWSGEDPTLRTSFKHTIERLGGDPGRFTSSELDALAAYVTSLTPPTAPTTGDDRAIARGKAIFHEELDCSACHDGDRLTDGLQYPLANRGLEQTDTPSLVGLAHTAPYYHDGSAQDLYTLVTDKGSVHDMSDFSTLTPAQTGDLVAYLQSL